MAKSRPYPFTTPTSMPGIREKWQKENTCKFNLANYHSPCPIANFPGPKLAAVTGWHEFYYACVLGGKFIFAIEDMHKKYGPIVRINPWELHIDDPEYYDRLYPTNSKANKYGWYYHCFGSPGAAFGTLNADLHRIRRAPISKYFSPAAVARVEPLAKSCMQKLIAHMESSKSSGNPFNLSNAFRYLGADVVSDYVMPRGHRMLDAEGQLPTGYNTVLRNFAEIATWNRHFRFILPVFLNIPRWVVAKLDPGAGLAVYDQQNGSLIQAAEVVRSKAAGDNTVTPSRPYPTILESLYTDLPPSERGALRLGHETQVLVNAGTETTGNALT